MIILFGILIVLLLIVSLYLKAIAPRTSHQKQCAAFKNLSFAHRGLFSVAEEIPENSMAAFTRAIALGYPIELDIQLTKDKEAVIFHDDTLKRMVGIKELVGDMTYHELSKLTLNQTSEHIPLLYDVLKLVDGQVPLLIEIKASDKNTLVCVVVNELLRRYKGSYCIESFNPFVLHWFREHNPEIIRGQLAERFGTKNKNPGILLFMSTNLLFNWYGKPDFISYNYRHAKNCFSLRLLRKFFNTPVFAWTIRSQDTYNICTKLYDAVIFDGFIPSDISK